MEYRIIFGESTVYLEKQVNDYLKNGWQCQGGVAVKKAVRSSPSEPILYFFQAIVREIKEGG